MLVRLRVGGAVFETTDSTLQRDDGMLARLQNEVNADANEAFIDRDPTHFRHILNYLRGSPTFPSSENELEQLQYEADFYLLPRLIQLIKHRTEVARRQSIAHQVHLLGSKLQH